MSEMIEPRLDRVPVELTSRKQWVVWKAVPKKKDPGKFTKVPYNPITKKKASSTRPADWVTFDDVVEAYTLDSQWSGIGFVFAAGDDIIGIDLDHTCFTEDGDLTDETLLTVNAMDSYTERSPSGRGLHIICRGRLPGSGRCDNRAGREIYSQGRFFTITADLVADKGTVEQRHSQVRSFYEKYWGAESAKDYIAGDLKFDKEEKVSTLESLNIGDYTRNLIVNGENMDDFTNAAGDADRSNALFFVCRELVIVGANKETILTVLTDKDYYLAQPSLERRKNRKSAMEWVWKYTLAKVLAQWEEEKSLFDDYQEGDATEEDEGMNSPDNDSAEEKKDQNEVPYVKSNFEKNALLFLKHSVPLVRYQEQFFRYSGKHWKLYTDELVERDVQVAVRGRAFSMAQINNTIKTVKRFSTKEDFTPSPTIIAFRNGVLDLDNWDIGLIDYSLKEHSHTYKTMSYLDFDYDGSMTCPMWLSFLNEVFEDDPERVKLLQQYIGYLLVYDYRWQKMLVMAGESRSGKGTILTVIEHIVGKECYVGTSLSKLGRQFGIHSLITAKVAVIGDAKQAGKLNINQAHETLLNITGGDKTGVERKNKTDFDTRIPARLIMTANSVPRFADEADALYNRYLVLPFRVSFAGREDVTLADKLKRECPGIFNWAVEGLLDLATAGRFVETAAGREKAAEMRVFNNPVGSFVEMFVVKDKSESVVTEDMFSLYERFCQGIEIKPTSKIDFSRKLGKAAPWIEHERESTGDRLRRYGGVKIDMEKLSEYVQSEF